MIRDCGIERFLCLRPDVTLMDLQMPVLDGHGAMLAMRALGAGAGAAGYLLKCAIRLNLADAIHRVHAGHRYIPAEVAAEMAAYFGSDKLSGREPETPSTEAIAGWRGQIEELVGPGTAAASAFRAKYLILLHDSPEVAMAHGALRQVLGHLPQPSACGNRQPQAPRPDTGGGANSSARDKAPCLPSTNACNRCG
ncbi:hypothetical protein RBA41_00255 [Massilia sp. CCM 9210]|uniref:hypothetical protein n=1 Tax=Massilia scottii TaxID=3057166 RepID=UPI002796C866|nr:hypothetical protein [Massilia sp. CCM 9210]MDQ1811730.1 hypothetical protein [Massilia sp. CCM 9210]